MSRFLVGTKAQVKDIKRALRQLEGYPARGVTVGPVKWEPPDNVEIDADGEPIPTPGWTTDAVDLDVEAGAQAVIDLPVALERHLGKTVKVGGSDVTLPAKATLVADEDALPKALKDARAAKRDVTGIVDVQKKNGKQTDR